MKKTFLGLFVGLALGSGATWLLLHHPTGNASPAPETPATAKSEEKPNPLRVPRAKREQSGIVLEKPIASALSSEVHGYGRVLDATSFATLVSEVETARATLAASEKELERAQKLFDAGGNASAQAVETAQAAATRDRAALTSAQARLGAAWGPSVVRSAAAISTALEQGAALARIDLLPGDAAAPDPKQARLTLPGGTENSTAEILGPAPVADLQVQGLSFLALVRQPTLPAGAAFGATLPGAGETTNALVIARGAIVYHQGSAWLFVLGEEDTFERKLVTLGQNVGPDRIAILSGLEPEEQVAIAGAQQLLAAELQAGGAAEP